MANHNQIWADVLLELYTKDMVGDSFDDYGYHEILRKKVISDSLEHGEEEDVYNSISSLEDLGLISSPPSGMRKQGFRLTKEGFEVAHEIDRRRRNDKREMLHNKRNHKVNRAIGLLTFALVVTGMVQATMTGMVGTETPVIRMNILLAAGGIFTIGILSYLYFEGLLTTWDEEDYKFTE